MVAATMPPARKTYAPREPTLPAWRGADRGIDLAPSDGACARLFLVSGRLKQYQVGRRGDVGRWAGLVGRMPRCDATRPMRYPQARPSPWPRSPRWPPAPQWTIRSRQPRQDDG